VDPPPSGMGNPEVSRDSGEGPPPEDITRELQKIKLPLPGVMPMNVQRHGWKA
jgi:hypothetical protein